MKSVGARSLNELQRLDYMRGYQDNSSSDGWEVTCFITPLHAKFIQREQNTNLHFMSFLHIDMTLVVEIFPQVRPGHTYST